MQGIIYWLISLIPVFLILFIVYKLDVIEKEPKLTLLFLLLSGCFSYLVVKYITYLFEDNIKKCFCQVKLLNNYLHFFNKHLYIFFLTFCYILYYQFD